MNKYSILNLIIIASGCVILLAGCKKYLQIAPPISSLTTTEIFGSNKQAEWAMAGVYSKMINGSDHMLVANAATTSFGAGLATIAGSFSADDLMSPGGDPSRNPLMQNRLTIDGAAYTEGIWMSAYKVIYESNGVIEGIAASTSDDLKDSVRSQLTGEALSLRAFSYFYLVNFFGAVPLALTTDFNQTVKLSKASVEEIYKQIIADLVHAKSLLSDNFKVGKNEKVRVTKWFAEALLARVYLYTGDFSNAITSATNVINQNSLFSLDMDINNVFLKNSTDAIFQLKPTLEDPFSLKNATPEGYFLYFNSSNPNDFPDIVLTEQLIQAFEPGDKRKVNWAAKHVGYYSPTKYKVGRSGDSGAEQPEYYTVMRLSEMYLIRAEAKLLQSGANKAAAINDLNAIRKRADIDDLEQSLSAGEVKDAIAHERRIEYFAEWGHRWFDLKRTGQATTVLMQMTYKSPWLGDYQLLYPIPENEIKYNNYLKQNPLYTR